MATPTVIAPKHFEAWTAQQFGLLANSKGTLGVWRGKELYVIHTTGILQNAIHKFFKFFKLTQELDTAGLGQLKKEVKAYLNGRDIKKLIDVPAQEDFDAQVKKVNELTAELSAAVARNTAAPNPVDAQKLEEADAKLKLAEAKQAAAESKNAEADQKLAAAKAQVAEAAQKLVDAEAKNADADKKLAAAENKLVQANAKEKSVKQRDDEVTRLYDEAAKKHVELQKREKEVQAKEEEVQKQLAALQTVGNEGSEA